MTKAQDRARERRRADRMAAKIASKEAESARNRVVAAVVIGVLVLVTGFVWLAGSLANRDADPSAAPTGTGETVVEPTATPSATQTTSATPSSSTSTAPALAKGCVAPPEPQANAKVITTAPDPTAVKGKTVTGVLKTTCGDIGLTLFADKAPLAVSSFTQLAAEDYWAPSPCHRLVTENIYVLQCGDPTGTGGAGPGYTFTVENAPKDFTYPRGTLAMARQTDPNTNGGQFFIVFKETQLPDTNGYTIFGEVSDGMDIVDRIAKGGVAADGVAPALPISILSVDTTVKG